MKVSVLMPTHNHENFIAQAIESFLAQNCSFDIELLISNDASTDNTLQVAQKYWNKHPHKIKLINHPENIGLLKNYKSIIETAQGEYFAILESDDYWTDVQKLQKQIDFLDAHPTYGLSFTGLHRLKNGKLSQMSDRVKVIEKHTNCLYELFILKNIVRSPTACFRRSFYEKYCNIDDYIRLDFKTFDYPVWASLVHYSDLHYMSTSTAVYRTLGTSISNSSNLKQKLQFENNIIQIRKYITTLYGRGKLSYFQVAHRGVFVKARHAFKLKKPVTALAIYCKEFVVISFNQARLFLWKK